MKRSFSGICNALITRIRLIFLKLARKKVQFSGIQHFANSVELNLDKNANVTFGNGVYLRKNCSLKVRKNAELILSDNVMLNNGCVIGCHDSIKIGSGTIFGPGVLMYDHDHDYKIGLKKSEYKTSPIVIGKNCWIGAGTIILRGTNIGDNCVVGAGSILKGQFSDNQMILQKRNTEVKTISYDLPQ